MKFKYLFVVLLTLAACSNEELNTVQSESVSDTTADEDPEEAYQAGINYVCFGDEMIELIESDLAAGSVTTKSSALNDVLEGLGIISIERLFPDAGEYEPRTRKAGLHKWYKVTYDESVPTTKAAEDLSAVEGVVEVEKVRKTTPASFNDTYYYLQWHYGVPESYGINLEKAWTEYTTGSNTVIVAIVDGGLNENHNDLSGRVLTEDEGSKSFVSGYDLTPMEHGCHIGGIVGAINNNGKGLCGIAGGDYAGGVEGVGLLSCMVFVQFDDGSSVSGDFASAIKYGADNGAVISQNSWSYTADTNGDGEISESEEETYLKQTIPNSIKTAVNYFVTYAGCDNDGNQLEDSPMKGGLVVFSAGNEGLSWCSPAYYESIVAVAATDSDGCLASYSNYGDWVDLCAPGSTIYSTLISGYGSMSGTSMAAPHVSGVAALLVSYYGGQGYTVDMLKEALINGANDDLITSSYETGPFLDAYGALCYDDDEYYVPATVSDYSVSASGRCIEFSLEVEENVHGVVPDSYMALASTDVTLLSGIDIDNLPSGVLSVSAERGDVATDSTFSFSLSGLEYETTYYVAVVACMDSGECSERSTIKSVTTTSNNPPVMTFSSTDSFSVAAYESVSVGFTVTDADGDEVDVAVSSDSGGAVEVIFVANSEYIMTITGNGANPGSFQAVIVAEDSYGNSAEHTVYYQLLPNSAPTLVGSFSNVILSSTSESVVYTDLDGYFNDDDGEDLNYFASSSNESALVTSVSGTTLTITAKSYGTATVTVTAADSLGESVSTSFLVLVRGTTATVDAYPNPVSSILYVRTGAEEKTTRVKIISETGTEVYSKTTTTSAFSPLAVDVSSFSAGKYILTVVYVGKTYQISIVKI